MEEWFLHLDYRFLGMHHDYRCRKKLKEGVHFASHYYDYGYFYC